MRHRKKKKSAVWRARRFLIRLYEGMGFDDVRRLRNGQLVEIGCQYFGVEVPVGDGKAIVRFVRFIRDNAAKAA